jgi:hypothetical protein
MKKKVLIIIGIVLLLIIALLTWFRHYTKSHSPVAKAEYHQDGTDIVVTYCQPYKKGRLIFGEESSGALQPYGKYWRVGANEATIFECNKDLKFGDQVLKAGKYSMHAYPGKDTWQVVFNSESERWGVPAPDASLNVLKADVPATTVEPITEQFVISFNPGDTGKVNMIWSWDQTVVTTPIGIQ